MGLYMDEAQLEAYCKRHGLKNPMESDGKQAQPKKDAPSKYSNRKTDLDGIRFDSKREADRYAQLKLLLHAREIAQILLQVPFPLPGGITYRADFVVLHRDGRWTVEDAKGFATDAYKLKKRLMREHWGIEIVEV